MTNSGASEVASLETFNAGEPDDILIIPASWEDRCLGLARLSGSYSCRRIILSVYDRPSILREKNIRRLQQLLSPIARTVMIPACYSNPLPSVRQTIENIKQAAGSRSPRLAIDISTFTRKHLLMLLQGLDVSNMLKSCRLYYTEPTDYHTKDDAPLSEGVAYVKAVPTFAGGIKPSKDTVLVLFLGYEGKRAQAVWEQIDANITLPVIPDPPTHEHWRGRTEAQNHYVLSSIPKEMIQRSHSLVPSDTERMLDATMFHSRYNANDYNYLIAPFGTKPQTVGIYRFLRVHPGAATIMYASPVRFREEVSSFPPGATWLVDSTDEWPDLSDNDGT